MEFIIKIHKKIQPLNEKKIDTINTYIHTYMLFDAREIG